MQILIFSNFTLELLTKVTLVYFRLRYMYSQSYYKHHPKIFYWVFFQDFIWPHKSSNFFHSWILLDLVFLSQFKVSSHLLFFKSLVHLPIIKMTIDYFYPNFLMIIHFPNKNKKKITIYIISFSIYSLLVIKFVLY